MTGFRASPVRRKRRPQRSNSLKDIGRLLGVAGTAHVDRKDKLLAQAATLNDTEGAARSNFWKIQRLNLFARELGFQIVTNDPAEGASRAFHFLEERPGALGQALLDDGPVGQALRHLRALYLDEGAPAPLGRQGGTQWKSARLGGPLPRVKKLATETKGKVNEAIVALREADPAFLAGGVRLGGSRDRYTDAAGVYGPSLNRKHRCLHRGGRQEDPKHLGQMRGIE